jgi:translocation and assembly module TamA
MSTELLLRRLFLLAVLMPAVALASPTVVVRIDGLSGEPLANVRASLSLENTHLRNRLTVKTIRQMYRDSTREIARALEPFGYYRPQIEASLQEPGDPGSPWLASFHIDAGEVVPVTDMDIAFVGEGANDADLAQAAKALPLRPGQGLDHRRYEEAKQDLLVRVQAFGYRDASLVAHRVEVDLASYTASVLVRVATGPRFVIGAIEFDQDEFQPEFLARYLLLEPGEPYTGSALARQRQALSRSGYFREVEIEPLPPADTAPDVIPLRIRLETFPRNRYRGRLAWGTDTGAGAQLDWNRRYLGGRGQHFTAGIAAVEERNKIAGNLSYVIPLSPLDGSKLTLGARHESKDLNFKDVELDEGGETRIETNLFSVNWRQPDRRWQGFDVKPTAGLTLLSENYDVFEVLFGNLSKAGQQVIIEAIGRSAYDTLTPDFEAVMPTLRLNLRRSNDRLFISNGDFFDLQLLGASESIGSNLSFWQARLNTWHIRELGADGRLLLRTNLGYSDANSSEVLGVNFNEMPEYYEFRAGGALSVRGYSFESLYPTDSITGGKHQLVGSIEYDYEFIPKFSLALFVDAGNAFNRWEDYDAKVGTGIGLRWRSPVGMARIDLGVPLNDSDESFQVYITVGPEF